MLKHCGDVVWQHIGIEAGISFADEILFFTYGNSQISSLNVFVNNSMILPDLSSINYFQQVTQWETWDKFVSFGRGRVYPVSLLGTRAQVFLRKSGLQLETSWK